MKNMDSLTILDALYNVEVGEVGKNALSAVKASIKAERRELDELKKKYEANARLIAAAPELYEENEQRSRLIGEVYILLLQGQTKEAIDLIYEQTVINFTDGPVAVSPALKKARGEI